jgi:hypothetical protein
VLQWFDGWKMSCKYGTVIIDWSVVRKMVRYIPEMRDTTGMRDSLCYIANAPILSWLYLMNGRSRVYNILLAQKSYVEMSHN